MSYPSIPELHADWPLAADVALVVKRVLSPGSVRFGTSVTMDAVAVVAAKFPFLKNFSNI